MSGLTTAEPAIGAPAPVPRGRRRLAFVTLLLLGAVGSVRHAVLPEAAENTPGELLVTGAISFTCALWCAFDAGVLGRRAPPILLAVVFLVLPVGLPIHFVWSRGLRGLLHGAAFVAVFVGVALAAGAIAESLVANG